MASGTTTEQATVAGLSFRKDVSFTDEGQVTLEVLGAQLTAGQSGSLSTRTTAASGVITISAHGIADTETIDLVWVGGYRYGCDIDSVTASTITFSGGAGDDLPVSATTVTVGVIVNAVTEFDGDDVKIFAVDSADTAQVVTFKDAGGLALFSTQLNSANDYTYIWSYGSGIANPLTGNAVASVDISCDATVSKFKIGVLKSGIA
jgi:hypothetical protein